MFERWGRRWECLRGYAVVDSVGPCFELRDITEGGPGLVVLFASWPEGGVLSVSQHRDGLAKEIVDWFINEAKVAIGPGQDEPVALDDRGH
jgi:hypothetical protein